MTPRLGVIVLMAGVCAACESEPPRPDASLRDGGQGMPDAAPADGGERPDAADGGERPDAGVLDGAMEDAHVASPCGHPDIQPMALTEYRMTWEQVFERAYPAAPGYLIPLGSFTPARSMDGPASAGMYLAIELTAQAGVLSIIDFAPSQPIAAVGYTQYRAGAAYVTVSPCAGDFRPHDPLSADPFLRNCRALMVEGGFFFGNQPEPPSHYCQLTAGERYFLNVVMAPPAALDGVTNSCEGDLTRCEVNAQPRFVRP